MTGFALLRAFGYLYAGAGIIAAVAMLADAYVGVGDKHRFVLGVALLVVPSALFSLALFSYSRSSNRSSVSFTFVLCLFAALYFLVNRIYGFYYWYTTGDSGLLVTWASLPTVWAELAICLALGMSFWFRHIFLSWLALVLGGVELIQEASHLPAVVNSYPSIRFMWSSMAPQVFKVAWLLAFVILLVAQLMDTKQSVPKVG
jgi:hypothetical protein